MEKICVAVRVRPSSNEESINGFNWKIGNNRISLHKSHGTPISGLSFAFDHVFDQESSNARIYELLTKDIISAAVEGFNGTAFAYGQTSSGKTFTMNGSDNDPGVIRRAVRDVFAKTQKTSDREFLIRVSYLEIYNEEINDLFTLENQKLQIHESLERGVFVAGLREEIVNSADQVLNLIQLGEANRHFGETNMNAHSSRSHTIFRMVIESKGKDNISSPDDAIRVSVLNLVDLAGSERIAKTGAGGVRLKEGKHINKSLMILGNVINKLSEGGKQRGHIPYRDSKLTRILQPALGGNAKTSIICTVAPEEVHIEETKGTLQFASRAKRITNCVQVNEILTDAALLKRQKLEIEELRRKLHGNHAEVLEQQVMKLRNDMLKNELEREKLAAELEEERRSHKEREQCIKEQQMKIDNLSNMVTLPDSDILSSHDDAKECPLAGSTTSSNSIRQEDAFSTPTFKAVPNVFVAKRSDYMRQPECSPLPDTFIDFADEDAWMKMNKGFVADLDLLHMTPARKVQSFPFSEDDAKECPLAGSTTSSNSIRQEDAFSTPTFKAVPNVFVAKRSDYMRQPECSPLPDTFIDFADEDAWMKMNKGFVADLDLLHMTPARKVQSFPFSEDCSMENNNVELQNLRKQLNLITEERDELKLKYTNEVSFNNQLTREISELQQEILLVRQIPQNLHESVTNCKDIYEDVFSILQNFVTDVKSEAGQILSTTSDIGKCLFSTLESHLAMAMDGKRPPYRMDDCSIRDQCNMLHQKLSGAISSLVLSDEDKRDSVSGRNLKGTLGEQIAHWKQTSENEVNMFKQKYFDSEEQLEISNQLLKVSEGKYHSLEREFNLLKKDRDSVVSASFLRLEQLTAQKEKALKLEELKQFHIGFARRQRSAQSIHSDVTSMIKRLRLRLHHPSPVDAETLKKSLVSS